MSVLRHRCGEAQETHLCVHRSSLVFPPTHPERSEPFRSARHDFVRWNNHLVAQSTQRTKLAEQESSPPQFSPNAFSTACSKSLTFMEVTRTPYCNNCHEFLLRHGEYFIHVVYVFLLQRQLGTHSEDSNRHW